MNEMNACLKSSPRWAKIERLQFRTIVRVQLFNGNESGNFDQCLLEIGKGRMPMDTEGLIQFKSSFCNVVYWESELINKVFPNLQLNSSNEE